MQKHPSQDILLRRVITNDLVPAVPLKLRSCLRRSAGSDKPYALTRHLRKALLGFAFLNALFQSSARKGWDLEPAHRRVSTLSGSLNAACSSVFVTAFVYEISCIISAFPAFVNAFLCCMQLKFRRSCRITSCIVLNPTANRMLSIIPLCAGAARLLRSFVPLDRTPVCRLQSRADSPRSGASCARAPSAPARAGFPPQKAANTP